MRGGLAVSAMGDPFAKTAVRMAAATLRRLRETRMCVPDRLSALRLDLRP